MAEKWNLIVDVARCDNCRLCFLAVKDEYVGNDFPGISAAQPADQQHTWLDIQRKERGAYPILEARFIPVMCNHCDDAPCMKAAEGGAVRKRADGIVIIDPDKAKGQKKIMQACPYHAIYWNEEKDIPQAWPFDAHLLDEGWTRTRAEQACPMDVYRTIKVNDEEMRRIQAEENLEVLRPELGTNPRVYYKNLHRITACFVGGTVVEQVDGVEECAAGAQVVLTQNGQEVGQATTDLFGEFTIDRLEPRSGSYRLQVTGPSGSFSTEFELGDESPYLGVMTLSAG
ncbi:MAG: 4Fe-4S dicluster domain-containing protein [Thermoanaerobaculales bacterium]|jgi:Fe-S-cluster-containing dehydrogenase component|nr:4Fe-4S dicluster domain-containing protein [Thermoanaerobaculales bacterium]